MNCLRDTVKELIDVNLDKARDLINNDLDKAKKLMDPTSIWTPVSNHIHVPRVEHRDDTFSASHH